MPRRLATCRACGKPVLFAAVGNKEGRPASAMPLNPDPDPDGNVAVYKDVTGKLVGRVVGKGGEHHGYEWLMMPHFATCKPQAEKQPDVIPADMPGVTFLDRYRKGKAAHSKDKRNQRGRRPGKPITGYRIPPRSNP